MEGITGNLNGQPLTRRIENLDYVCYFDGTLYNAGELWRKIHDRCEDLTNGIDRANATDAETALYAYCCWGGECVEYFDGMFAFTVWDGTRLFMARDQLGVKPLFYYISGDGLAFASDLKRLQAPAVIGRDGIFELLLLGPGRTPGSGIFSGVRALLPGECATYSRKAGLRTRKYFKFKAEPFPHSFEEAAAAVKSFLADSVKKQSLSGKPVSSFLSGGLDSSAIAALSGVSETFSVDYADNELYFTPDAFQPEGDDEYIRRMSEFLGTHHTKIIINAEELAAALGGAVTARGLPGMADVDASLLVFCRRVRKQIEAGGGSSNFSAANLGARSGVPSGGSPQPANPSAPPVVLSGECADEYKHTCYNLYIKHEFFL